MDVLLQRLAHQLWPDFDALDEHDRSRLLAELATSLLSLPLVALSLGWLIAATDFSLVRTQWPALLLILVLGYTFSQVSFFQVIGTRSGEFSFNSTNLGSILLVSTLLLLGPLAIWPYVFLTVSYRITQQRHLSRVLRWNWLRNLLHNLWSTTLSSLVALSVYRTLGGSIPLADLSLKTVGPAFVAVTVLIALNSLFLWGLFIVQTRLLPRLQGRPGIEGFRESVGFFLLSEIPAYFGIMAAGLYTQIGVGAFSFFMAGVVMVSLLARRLSQAAMMGQQRFTRGRSVGAVGTRGHRRTSRRLDLSYPVGRVRAAHGPIPPSRNPSVRGSTTSEPAGRFSFPARSPLVLAARASNPSCL